MATDGHQTEYDAHERANCVAVRQHYAAFARGDIDDLLAGLDPCVAIIVYDEHGKGAGKPVTGHEGARAFFEGISAAVTDSTVEIQHLRADGNRVLARIVLGGKARRSGRAGTIQAVHLFTLHESLITEIRTHRPDWRRLVEPVPLG